MQTQQKINEAKQLLQKSKRFIKSCQKPSNKEYKTLLKVCGIGIGVIGIVGYSIKAVSYPLFTRLLGLNNINED